jgi:hypothetical protein
MSSLISVIAGSRRRFDPDAYALDYFSRITAAGSSISDNNKIAASNFIRGCWLDGNWNAIKACCLLAGADSLSGALVPLVGPVPTNNNFVEADYSRTTGLSGDGLTKDLNSNYNPNTTGQDDVHAALWVTTLPTATLASFSSGRANTGSTAIAISPTNIQTRCRSLTITSKTGAPTGFTGVSRNNSTDYVHRSVGSNATVTVASQTPYNATAKIFNHNPAPASFFNGRISFYSTGQALDLTLLDARLATYMSSLT